MFNRSRFLLLTVLFLLCSFMVVNANPSEESKHPASIGLNKTYFHRAVNIQDILYQKIAPFPAGMKVFGLSLEANVELHHYWSLVRVILIDSNAREYLLYEAYPLIVDETVDPTSFSIKQAYEETGAFANAIVPVSLTLKLVDAAIRIDRLAFSNVPVKDMPSASEKQSLKIQKMNARIQKMGMNWIAGETPISRLPYSEKRKLFRNCNYWN